MERCRLINGRQGMKAGRRCGLLVVLGLIFALGVTAVPAMAQDALICRKRDKQGDKSGDTHRLGKGDDYFNGGDGNDVIYGGPGDDILNGGRGNDKVYGGPGDDIVCGGINNDKVFGDGGNDELYGEEENDFLDGGPGNDYLNGQAGRDRLFGFGMSKGVATAEGNDFLEGSFEKDVLVAGGFDFLIGGAADDILFSKTPTLGVERMDGGFNDDRITGSDADDKLLLGDAGDDIIHGGGGADEIRGGNNDDTLFGDGGNDSIFGELGRDILDGGTEDDLCDGGEQPDQWDRDVLREDGESPLGRLGARPCDELRDVGLVGGDDRQSAAGDLHLLVREGHPPTGFDQVAADRPLVGVPELNPELLGDEAYGRGTTDPQLARPLSRSTSPRPCRTHRRSRRPVARGRPRARSARSRFRVRRRRGRGDGGCRACRATRHRPGFPRRFSATDERMPRRLGTSHRSRARVDPWR